MDYKNTPEGRAVQSKYGKILHASRPEPPYNHPRMPMSNRAKIFSPFAALRGYEDEIASEGRDHLKGNRIELSEEGKEALNQKISQLRKGQEITIKYFMDGYYEDIVGVLDPSALSDSSRHRTPASASSDRRRVFLFSSFYSCSSSGNPSGSWKKVIFLPV